MIAKQSHVGLYRRKRYDLMQQRQQSGQVSDLPLRVW